MGGLCFIVPGLVAILALAALFLAGSPPRWMPEPAQAPGRRSSRSRCTRGGARPRQLAPRAELTRAGCSTPPPAPSPRRRSAPGSCSCSPPAASSSSALRGATPRLPLLAAAAPATGGLLALSWVALKVGGLAYGGGFVIVPLMQARRGRALPLADGHAVPRRRRARPGNAGAGHAHRRGRRLRRGGGRRRAAGRRGRVRAVVRLRALGVRGTSTALRSDERARAFLDGAGPAAIGAILGVGDPARAGAGRALAVGRARRRGRRALRTAPRRRRDPRRRRPRRCDRGAAR